MPRKGKRRKLEDEESPDADSAESEPKGGETLKKGKGKRGKKENEDEDDDPDLVGNGEDPKELEKQMLMKELICENRKLGGLHNHVLKAKVQVKVNDITRGIVTVIKTLFNEGEAIKKTVAKIIAQGTAKFDKKEANAQVKSCKLWSKKAKKAP